MVWGIEGGKWRFITKYEDTKILRDSRKHVVQPSENESRKRGIDSSRCSIRKYKLNRLNNKENRRKQKQHTKKKM